MKYLEVVDFDNGIASNKWEGDTYPGIGVYRWPDGDLVFVYGDPRITMTVPGYAANQLLKVLFDREEPNIDVHRFLDQLIKLQNPPTREI